MKKILIHFFFIFFVFIIFAQIDKDEININKNIEFINYSGQYTVTQSALEIRSIGWQLANGLKFGNRDSFKYHEKYSVRKIRDDNEKDKFDADIFSIDRDSNIDHIRNVRNIISGYISTMYNYSGKDANTIAYFLTIYNAVYRKDINYISSRYKNAVIKNINPEKLGIALRYDEWPGNTEIIIPITQSISEKNRIDLFTINDDKTKETLKDDNKNIDLRKDLVNIQEKEIKKDQKEIDKKLLEIEKDKTKLQKEEEKINVKKEEIAKKQDELTRKQNETQKKIETTTDPKEKERLEKEKEQLKKEQEKLNKEKEEQQKKIDQLNKSKEEIKKQEEEATKKQKELEQKKEIVEKEKEQINKDQTNEKVTEKQTEKTVTEEKKDEKTSEKTTTEKVNETTEKKQDEKTKESPKQDLKPEEVIKKQEELAKKEESLKKLEDELKQGKTDPKFSGGKFYYLKVIEFTPDGHYNNEMYIIDPISKQVLVKSPFTDICGRKYFVFSKGVLVVGHKGKHQTGHYLTMLSADKLELIKMGENNLYYNTFVEVRDDFIFAILKEQDNYYLGKFDMDLKLVKKSNMKVQRDTFISFYEKNLYVNDENKNILILDIENLTNIGVVKP